MTPLSLLLISIPQGHVALGCFQRIQGFLSGDSWEDHRLFDSQPSRSQGREGMSSDDVELVSSPRTNVPGFRCAANRIQIVDGTFSWKDSDPSIQNVTLCISWETQFTIILGPVSCSKSTLLKAILISKSYLRFLPPILGCARDRKQVL